MTSGLYAWISSLLMAVKHMLTRKNNGSLTSFRSGGMVSNR